MCSCGFWQGPSGRSVESGCRQVRVREENIREATATDQVRKMVAGPEPWAWEWRAMDMFRIYLEGRLDRIWGQTEFRA